MGDGTSAVTRPGVPPPEEESLASQNNCIKPHNLEKVIPWFLVYQQIFNNNFFKLWREKKASTSHMVSNAGSLTLQSV